MCVSVSELSCAACVVVALTRCSLGLTEDNESLFDGRQLVSAGPAHLESLLSKRASISLGVQVRTRLRLCYVACTGSYPFTQEHLVAVCLPERLVVQDSTH